MATDVQRKLITTLPQLSGLRVIQCTYFNKSIDDNWLVAFHQDRSIPVSDRVSPNYAGHSRKEDI
ncbi:hypothetical protein, partial [Okeania sp. SIO2G5]|uniref:hypothetical protein n=1 Tax=Okeania sp. SIO2G5 TaxID=2607796 RepID=UPI00257BE9AC